MLSIRTSGFWRKDGEREKKFDTKKVSSTIFSAVSVLNQAMCVERVCDGALKVEIDADFLPVNRHHVNVALHPLGRTVVFGIEIPRH